MSGKTFRIQGNDISDGYHTFDELYEHRCLLFINLCLQDRKNSFWKPHFEGWFCLYWESAEGQVSYHVPYSMLQLIEGKIERHDQHTWDGHTSGDVIRRLAKLAGLNKTKPPVETQNVVHAARVGGYLIIEKDYADMPWIYGPDGDGMAMSEPTLKKFEEHIGQFFREHM